MSDKEEEELEEEGLIYVEEAPTYVEEDRTTLLVDGEDEVVQLVPIWDRLVLLKFLELDSIVNGLALLAGVVGSQLFYLLLDGSLTATRICKGHTTLWLYHFVPPALSLAGALLLAPINMVELGLRRVDDSGEERKIRHHHLKSCHMMLAIILVVPAFVLSIYFLITDWIVHSCHESGVKLLIGALCPVISVVLWKLVTVAIVQKTVNTQNL